MILKIFTRNVDVFVDTFEGLVCHKIEGRKLNSANKEDEDLLGAWK